MKGIFCLFFGLSLGAGGLIVGAGTASAQAMGFLVPPDSLHILLTGPIGAIRTMSPDRMPCLVPDLARLERMPILRSRNGDPMPNGSGEKPPDGR